MEQNKLEDKIRTQLQERELQPSEKAWEKLEAKLGTPKRKSYAAWYAVAASFVGILIVASLFFTGEEGGETKIVENASKIEENKTTSKEIVAQPETEIAVETVEEKIIESPSQKEIISEKNKLKPHIKQKVIKTEAIAKTGAVKEKNQKITPETINNKEEEFVNTKIDEVVAQVQKLQNENTQVTATEVDRLLKEAQREISSQRTFSNPQKVDAAALLLDVEMEMERSFRDKVFDALGESFEKIRSAVAEINN